MTSLAKMLSLLAAASMAVSGAMNAAAPQHDPDGLLFLVNRQNMVSMAFEPDDLEMSETGCQLLSISGFRSYAKQEGIYRRKLRSVKGDTEKAQEYVAPPGASEHQTGLAMDIGQKNKIHLETSFRDTVGGIWCRENCWRFGFILRYNEGWEEITGYSYEPWHFRYVGKEFAKQIHDANVPLETWLAEYRVKNLREIVSDESAAAEPAEPTE